MPCVPDSSISSVRLNMAGWFVCDLAGPAFAGPGFPAARQSCSKAWILALFQNTITVRTKSSGDSPAFRKPQRQFNHYTTTFQSRCEHNQPPRNREPTPTTTQPSFVSNPRTIPTQPSHIHYSPTATHKRLKFWYNISAFSEEDVGLKNRAGGPSEMMLI